MPAPDRGRVAEGLGVAWDTANDAVQAEGKRILINDENRFDVTATGVDEHVWRHTRRGDKFPTVIIDLTALRDGTGPARLLDMVEGRSKQAFKTWLADRPQAWRDAVGSRRPHQRPPHRALPIARESVVSAPRIRIRPRRTSCSSPTTGSRGSRDNPFPRQPPDRTRAITP